MSKRNLIQCVLPVALMLGLPALASAHAFLDHSSPRVGSTVQTSPTRVEAYFTQQVEPAFSTLHVLGADDKPVDKSDAQVDPKNPSELFVDLPDLPAGTYTVEWKVTSVDTHRTHGRFTFTVQPKG